MTYFSWLNDIPTDLLHIIIIIIIDIALNCAAHRQMSRHASRNRASRRTAGEKQVWQSIREGLSRRPTKFFVFHVLLEIYLSAVAAAVWQRIALFFTFYSRFSGVAPFLAVVINNISA